MLTQHCWQFWDYLARFLAACDRGRGEASGTHMNAIADFHWAWFEAMRGTDAYAWWCRAADKVRVRGNLPQRLSDLQAALPTILG